MAGNDNTPSGSRDSSLEIPEFETQFVPQEDDEETLWDVLEILAEKGKQYKVRWEGVDPKTKKPWPPSWVPKHDCTDALVREWKRNKAREKKEASKPNTRVKDTKKVTGKTESAKGKGKERARDEEPEAHSNGATSSNSAGLSAPTKSKRKLPKTNGSFENSILLEGSPDIPVGPPRRAKRRRLMSSSPKQLRIAAPTELLLQQSPIRADLDLEPQLLDTSVFWGEGYEPPPAYRSHNESNAPTEPRTPAVAVAKPNAAPSSVKSLMKGRSAENVVESPLDLSKDVDRCQEKSPISVTRVLRRVPVVSPSAFREYLPQRPQRSPNLSQETIEQFSSPEKTTAAVGMKRKRTGYFTPSPSPRRTPPILPVLEEISDSFMAPDDAVIPIEDVIHLDQVEETAHMRDPEDQGIDIQIIYAPDSQLEETPDFSVTLRLRDEEISTLRNRIEDVERAALEDCQKRCDLVKSMYETRFKRFEDDIVHWKGLYEVLRKQNEQTDDNVRRRAAEEPELRARNERLEVEVVDATNELERLNDATEGFEVENEQLQEDNERLKGDLAKAQNVLERLNELESSMVSDSSLRNGRRLILPSSSHSPQDMTNWMGLIMCAILRQMVSFVNSTSRVICVDCTVPELLGVVGTTPAEIRLERAVKGVGALIKDFLGVSVTVLLLRLPEAEAVFNSDLAAPGEGLVAFDRFPANTNGWRNADWGFSRRSGSHARHFPMKSTNESSSHLRTCARVLLPGRLRRPFEFTTGRGAPVVSSEIVSSTREDNVTTQLTEEQSLPRAAINEVFIWHSKNLHDAGQLLLLVLAREYREPCV
ncbi:hypothetical protein PHLCEN_2v2540 [Hermanssonia centrifuga]|uniref:Chromo domain-containing protein n=1 Tax=Hermanssonia centrifuga TaxID=98765 RepID=A0A2R6RLR3_9APHY|nr:hypothetical protein PHLCEN_2v2540 [Hermanssonia centrifuga]